MYAVMGITGQVGSAVAENLHAKDKPLRAIVREAEKAAAWKARGAEIAVADYNDSSALEQAFRGVEAIFVMIPPTFAPLPGFPEARATIAAVKKALAVANPPKAVYLSSIGAQRDSGLGLITALHILEEELRTLPFPSAFLRAGWFMENSQWDVASARDQGKIFSFLQPSEKAFPLVATADIGRVAAETLSQSWTGPRFIEIAGLKHYSPRDLASAFSKVLGRPVELAILPREKWVETFVAQGTPRELTPMRVEMLDAFNSGWIDFGVPGTEHLTGTVELESVIRKLAGQGR